MELNYVDQWEFNESNDNWKEFIKDHKLANVVYNRFKDGLTDWTDTIVTKKNMMCLFEKAVSEFGFYNTHDLLEGLAQQYIEDNDLFDQVFIIEDSDEFGLYKTFFYAITPVSQADLKRFIEKHLDACKNGFSEIVEDVIERRSRNTLE